MNIRFAYTRLLVRDFKKNFLFYRDIMGFKPRFGGEDGPYEEFQTGSVVLALFRRDFMNSALAIKPKPQDDASEDTAALIFEVPNVDAACIDLEKKGVKIIAAPTDRKEWIIRTAHFRDPDNNLIEIFNPLAPE
jgi:catechol 2,3-dioxygenase-like lactoylglutathione lyase family enzyme